MDIFGFLAFLGAFLFVFFLVGIVLYILMSIGFYKMAKNQGIQYEWLAFVPIAQLYIFGKIIKSLRILNYDIPSVEIVLPVGALVVMVLSGVPLIGFLLSIALAVLFYAALFRLFCLFRSRDQAQTMLVISLVSLLLGGFMAPIYVFLLRDEKVLET